MIENNNYFDGYIGNILFLYNKHLRLIFINLSFEFHYRKGLTRKVRKILLSLFSREGFTVYYRLIFFIDLGGIIKLRGTSQCNILCNA